MRNFKLLANEGSDFSEFKNANSLVNRLRSLVYEQEAGNTGVDREISNLIGELRARGVIYA